MPGPSARQDHPFRIRPIDGTALLVCVLVGENHVVLQLNGGSNGLGAPVGGIPAQTRPSVGGICDVITSRGQRQGTQVTLI